jgi:hypothetical protein
VWLYLVQKCCHCPAAAEVWFAKGRKERRRNGGRKEGRIENEVGKMYTKYNMKTEVTDILPIFK